MIFKISSPIPGSMPATGMAGIFLLLTFRLPGRSSDYLVVAVTKIGAHRSKMHPDTPS
jgi:hypothetical protein